MTTTAAAEVAGHAAAAPKSVFSRMRRPIFLVVAEDGPRRKALTADLNRRYAANYQVTGAASAGTALRMLADFADSGAIVALVCRGPDRRPGAFAPAISCHSASTVRGHLVP